MLVHVVSAGVEQETFKGVCACGFSLQRVGTGHTHLREADDLMTVSRANWGGVAEVHVLFLSFPAS